MRFYTGQHQHYCGIDLHARTLYLCVQDAEGNILLHKNLPCDRQIFLDTIEPFRDDLVVASGCIFNWYWLADLCADHDIHFVLGHALYMRAIHGAKAKNDKIDSLKTASLLRGGLLPMAYAYPSKMRATRDLLRRRTPFVRKRGQLTAHIQNTFHQYNLPRPPGFLVYKHQRAPVPAAFADPIVRKAVEADLALCETYDDLIRDLENTVLRQARLHDPNALLCLNTIPGIGKICLSPSSMRSTISAASTLSSASLPMLASSNARRRPPENEPAHPEPRSATLISNGPSVKLPSPSSAISLKPKSSTAV